MRGMTSALFWQLIEGHPADEDGEWDALTSALAARTEAEIVAFAESLARALYELDTEVHCSQPVQDVSEPDGLVLGMSSDVFLYARCAVVAAGRQTWAQVLAEPAAFAGRWEVADAEALLYVANEAFEQATGRTWEHDTAVSYETGSNPAGWPGTDEDDEGPGRGRPVVAAAWAFEEGVAPPEAYLSAGMQLSEAISENPAWQRWWAGTGLTNVRLHPYYTRTGGGEHPDQRRSSGEEAVVHCTFDAARFDATDEADLVELAAQDFLTMFELVRAERSLPALPSLP
jgi:hypothetical protein